MLLDVCLTGLGTEAYIGLACSAVPDLAYSWPILLVLDCGTEDQLAALYDWDFFSKQADGNSF